MGANEDTAKKKHSMENNGRWFPTKFSDPDIEKLYELYSVKQKQPGLPYFIYASLFFNVYMGALSYDRVFVLGLILGFTVINVILLACILLSSNGDDKREDCTRGKPNSNRLEPYLPYLAWIAIYLELFTVVIVNMYEVNVVGWLLVFIYLSYVTLPLRLFNCLILSVLVCGFYSITLLFVMNGRPYLLNRLSTNLLLMLAAHILGLTCYFLNEKQQRQAFRELRQSLEVKLVIEEQSAEQERLLLSVLPEHVAVQMRQDLGSADSQFKKIYMSRHENVSILYADIVGFTAISSTYSAQDLVKILNELFARFDKLSEKYEQLRIKILGDCYYCVSGAPKERPDHAVLCVHMGLSMVKAIKYVQQTTNSPVDMRVGIHTGAVLAGVLGQRQWQFDVYSKDVELANKMESSGMAGRVHISEKTLSFLNGEFEVEPAFGEKREEVLRMAGIKTYFIVSVLKPFQPKRKVKNGSMVSSVKEVQIQINGETKKDDDDDFSSLLEECQVLTPEKGPDEDLEDFKERLRAELINRDGHKELKKHSSPLTLWFTDGAVERSYDNLKDSISKSALFGCFFVVLLRGVSYIFVLPVDILNLVVFVVSLLLVILFIYIVTMKSQVQNGNWSIFRRKVLTVACISILGLENIFDSMTCAFTHSSTNDTIVEEIPQVYCVYPSYYSIFTVLILAATSMPGSLSHIFKIILLAVITAAQCAVNIVTLCTQFTREQLALDYDNFSSIPQKYTFSALLVAITIILIFLCRHIEQVSRVLFLWRREVEEQRECASDMRQRNEALVYNILPPHVAAHFMGNRKRQHDELYSQSYAETGVLFASMPNFSDFYSEETVNNQGLECLRFLNEVISDFDALLEWPQFSDIIKIKTIGSTYMAASGLNPSRQVKPDDPIDVRWAHLALLVEFALELKKALQGINEQSFNHFVLKMGINHGPITAGVIGARKPHYDIWGNTVNVASRMESTGKAGCIQVTEETCNILQHFGYKFEQRGLVYVKGKGQLMTYYLIGKGDKVIGSPPHQASENEVSAQPKDTLTETSSLLQH